MRLKLDSGQLFLELEAKERFKAFNRIRWKSFLRKTYLERRTPLHVFINFIAIWILHFWTFYLSFSIVVEVFPQRRDFQNILIGCGGIICSALVLTGIIGEMLFLPRLSLELFICLGKAISLLGMNVAIPFCAVFYLSKQPLSPLSVVLSVVQIILSCVTFLITLLRPRLRSLTTHPFKADLASLPQNEVNFSRAFWLVVYTVKFTASYFYLIQPAGYSAQVILASVYNCSTQICLWYGLSLMVTFVLLNFVLFLLDSYIWYIIFHCVVGVVHSFQSGLSIWSPWKQIFARLPERIMARLVAPDRRTTLEAGESLHKTSHIWNAMVDHWFADFIISAEQREEMKFQSNEDEKVELPHFFTLSEEGSVSKYSGEALRRAFYFAQSLDRTMPMPQCAKVSQLPLFTVLVPHYSEKILLSMKDLIHTYDGHDTDLSLLDYLKTLYPMEWHNYVDCCRSEEGLPSAEDCYRTAKSLSLEAVGFSDSNAESRLRTRIWASRRSQTLFRTIQGFQNYKEAIQFLEKVEEDEISTSELQSAPTARLMVAMQRYDSFTDDELEEVEILLKLFPIQIAFIQTNDSKYYSCLIDSECERNGLKRVPRYRIQLPGNPILGDGKSDNQNHSIIFSRGEIIQLVDANQDNYFEEALKIRNVLLEMSSDEKPLSILGAREHIFSEGIGVLGDVAAGKEYTFGTISQRVLSILNVRLHYGHPDFLNLPFVISRGGISKGQRGLHLNEDIYAGMTALLRGGIIKHSEYFQVGKGRDLGFGSILSFVSKIGSGMGEQTCSREHYYLGLALPLDRLFSYYFGHPGFHMNNILSMFSIKLFVLLMVQIFCFSRAFDACPEYLLDSPIFFPGCFRMDILRLWLFRSVSAIIVVLLISYVPFLCQLTCEFGIGRCMKRFLSQIISFSPMFEVFTTQIYAYNLGVIGWSHGGSGYIATGRGFSTYRNSFASLYQSYSRPSFYLGLHLFSFILIVFASPLALLSPFFVFVTLSLLYAPFIFNVGQFALGDFVLDYEDFIQWFARGNIESRKDYSCSWIAHHHNWRASLTGIHADSTIKNSSRSHIWTLFLHEVLPSLFTAVICCTSYVFYKISTSPSVGRFPWLIHLVSVGILPGAMIMAITLSLTVCFVISLLLGTIFLYWQEGNNAVSLSLARIVRIMSVGTCVAAALSAFPAEQWSWSATIMRLISSASITNFLCILVLVVFVSKDRGNPEVVNYAWWSGKWFGSNLGCRAFTAIPREFLCKIVEQYHFSLDFLLGSVILISMLPLALLPGVDTLQRRLVLWDWSSGDKSKSVVLQRNPALQKKASSRKILAISLGLSIQYMFIVGLITIPNITTLPSFSISQFLRF